MVSFLFRQSIETVLQNYATSGVSISNQTVQKLFLLLAYVAGIPDEERLVSKATVCRFMQKDIEFWKHSESSWKILFCCLRYYFQTFPQVAAFAARLEDCAVITFAECDSVLMTVSHR